MCIELLVHGADISNPIKDWECVQEWTKRVFEEFWMQVRTL